MRRPSSARKLGRRRLPTWRWVGLPLLAAVILAGGCGAGDIVEPEDFEEFANSPDRDEAAFQTDRLEYTLERTSYGYRMDIAFRFTNPTNGAAYFVNCLGGTGVVLDKREDGVWKSVWAPVLLQCLSPPIVVAAGADWSGVVGVVAGEFGTNRHPQFETQDLEGVYRLRWVDLLRTYEPNRYPFGEPLPEALRVSNRFVVRVAP